MKKLRKRIFAAVLAALMMVTAMPVTVLYASAETVSDNAIGQAGTEDTEETADGDTEETGTDGAEATGDSDTEEPAQEPPTGPLEEDTAECICKVLCTEDSINGDCPVCGAEGAGLSACKGKEQGSVPETDTEDDNAGIDTAECICEILCTEDSINGDCPVCGADDADLSACKGKEQGSAPEKDTEDDNADTDTAECICETLCTEDSINEDCSVCGAEGADLSSCKGEKTEVQEVTGEKVITAWEWIDPEEYLTDGILALPGAGRENPAFVEDVTALLPEKIQAKVAAVNAAEDGEETEEDAETAPETEDAEITLTGWECASYPEDGAYEGTYTFTASLPEGFVLAEDAAALEVEVELGGGEMLEGEVSADYQEASWNGSEVTYTGKTENCTSVESSTEAVTWNAGWYVVSGTVTISEPITVTGAVNLILGDGCTLNAEKGIVVTTGNSLTIYAQSGGTGTLNATGTTDSSNNASAGIGGSTTIFDSGSITIHGGVINATGGASRWYSGAGIGGSTPSSGNGGNSGTIKIYGGTITAESRGFSVGAGIGGGGSGGTGNGGAGTNISIYGGNITAMSYSDNNGGAGIGGGSGQTNGGTGNITIGGGTIHSTGGFLGAGIGGGSGGTQSGNGTVTISGGKVTAVGGNYAAGIGGGGGTKSQYLTWIGGIGSVTITGGIVDAKGNGSGEYAGAPIGNGGNAGDTAATVSKTNAIVFENGAGTVCGDVTLDGSYTVPGDYTLNIPVGASLSGSGTLSGGSAFTTENLTADMISVPTNLYYDGKDRTEYLTTELSGELDKGITICGQTFTVSGWTLAVAKTDDLTYTATYTNNNDNTNTFTKTITLQKSGTDLTSEGKVQTYKGDTLTKDFTASDTITVKATPTATGEAPAKAAARLRGNPTAGQMAVFVGDTQVSAPADKGADGAYTMTVSASDVLVAAGGPKTGITLTAKFIGNDSMADGEGTATVNITAVARVEKDGITSYVDKNGLLNAFDIDNGNNGAVITLLEDVELTGNSCISIQIDCTLDFGGHTILADATAVSYAVLVPEGKTVTIRGAGGISGINNSQALQISGNVTLEGGTFSCAAGSCVSVVSNSASLSVTSPNVRIENTAGRGLRVALAQSVQLSAGTYSGTTEAITFGTNCSLTLTDLLAEGYAYYNGDTPIALQPDGKELTGTVTVKECNHTGGLVPSENGYQHGGPCKCCGSPLDTANHTLGADNQCSGCGAELVAKVEKSNSGGTEYMTAKGLNTVFAYNSGYEDATVTLLDDLTNTDYANRPKIDIRCTLNLNGHTLRSDLSSVPTLEVSANGNVTIAGSGEIVSNSDAALYVVGTAVLEGGTFCSGGTYHGAVEVLSSNLSVTGENVVMENTGSGYGLLIYSLKSVKLSAGKYSGAAGAISVSTDAFTLSSLLNQEGTSRVAYYKDNTTLVTEGLDGQTLPSGSYTVKACTHAYQYTHTTGATTHSQTCPACGDAKAAETCSYDAATGRCACGSTLAVTLPADLALTYDGTAKTPDVTVTVDGTPLTEGYSVAYNNNINAGNAAAVTITGTSFTGTVTLTFSIGKATPTIAWSSTSQELTYTGQQAVIIAPTVTLENNENFGGTISYSYKKQGETDYKDGLPTDAGTYTIKAHVDAEGNYNAADSINELTLTIKKADAEITVGTAAYDVNYGDPAFTISGVTDTNPETAVQYAVTEGTDVISVSNGTVTIKNAGTATITVSLPETANYNAAANKTITVTVAKKGGYTVSEINKKYYYDRENTAEINLASLLPRDCGTVTYGEPVTSGDVTFTAKAVENGVLSYTLAKGNVNDAGTITVTVTTRNYEDITVTVKAVLTDQIPVELKEGTEVTLANTILTYGESLSGLGFNNAVFVDGDGKTVEGILAWKDAAAKPSAGTASAVWVFIPTDNAYAPVEGTAAITVNKAVPTVSAAPAVADRIYNPSVTLKGDDLTSATVTGVDGNTLKGGWNWQSADIVPTVNNSGYAAIFTPEDTTNYETVTRTITVNVTKATPYIAKSPAAAGITYGDTLNASALSGGTVLYGDGKGQEGDSDGNTVAVTGTFTWQEPSAKPVVADSNVTEYTVVFTPSDTANYNPVEAKVTLTVNKAQNAPNMPGSTMDVSNSLEKVGDVSLPEGWEWQASDQDTALEVGKPVSAVAVYAGADKGNYENETVTVAITRSACDHVAGEILYTGAGEKAPTCTEDGLGHRECTKCSSVVESGIVVKALGHTGGTATCSKRAVCTRCGQPYGDTDGSVHGDTEVRGFVAATCTAGGYTGDTYCKDCGAKTKTGNATPALGHNYTSTVTKEPTTGSEGTRTYTCTRCGHSYTESIPKLPEETHHHSYSGSVTKQPTCTDTGIRTYTCSCGDSYTETIAALGHHYQSSVTKQPTTMSEGVMTYTCDRCGHSYTRPIAKLPGDDTAKPGDTGPGGNTEEIRPDTGIPFIKDEDGKIGWDVIRAEEEQAQEGSTINVDMNGTTVVPGDIFDSIKGKDITITFDMGNGIIWSVDGKGITTDKAGDIDFSVKTGVKTVPVDIVNNVTGENYSIQISLAYEGEFGFTAVLSIGLGRENAGYTASLYCYNESTGELEFICSDEVAEDGTVSLAFTHASDYVIAIDGDGEEESGNAAEPEQPDTPDKDSTGLAEESQQTGQAWRPWWIIVVGALVVIMGIGVFFVVKKGKDGDSGQV